MVRKTSAIVIMPRPSTAWLGSEALWITAAGWASAAEKRLGAAWVITTDRISSPEEAYSFPRKGNAPGQHTKRQKFLLPNFIRTFLKDLLLWKNRNRKSYSGAPWDGMDVKFVWEQHDLFPGPGRQLASKLKVPLVMYVHAPVVWEANKWGVKRYLWGWFLENWVEARSLKKADLVACVSQGVADKVAQMGVSQSKIIVSPMAVDPNRFEQKTGGDRIRKKYGIQDKTIIGWTGSFRGFHGLEDVLRAFRDAHAQFPIIRLLLVGDGPERAALEDKVRDWKLQDVVFFSGRVPFSDIPAYVSAFDVAIVSAGRAADFHYSPLKLPEYMAARKAVLAPNAGAIPTLFRDGTEILLYEVGNQVDMKDKLMRLISDTELRARFAEEGYQQVLRTGTWEFEITKVLAALPI